MINTLRRKSGIITSSEPLWSHIHEPLPGRQPSDLEVPTQWADLKNEDRLPSTCITRHGDLWFTVWFFHRIKWVCGSLISIRRGDGTNLQTMLWSRPSSSCTHTCLCFHIRQEDPSTPTESEAQRQGSYRETRPKSQFWGGNLSEWRSLELL